MTYQLVFDANTARYPILETVTPWLAVGVMGLLLAWLPNLYPGPRRAVRAFGLLFALAGGGVAVSLWQIDADQRARVRGALHAGTFVQVEGIVEQFRPGGSDGHPAESFTVAGRTYRYSPAYRVYGFATVAASGGPIRDGLRVRIADVDGVIARLEVAR